MSLSDDILNRHYPGIRRWMLGGVDVNMIDEYGFTPLIEAAIADDVEIAHMLIHAGADVNLSDMTGATALHWACENNNVHLAKVLLENSANPNQCTTSNKPPLLMPYLRKQADIKTLLYQYGADLRYCQDYINAKLLGHRFELIGCADIVDREGRFTEVDFEGFFLEFTLSVIESSLREFTFNFAARELRQYHDALEVISQALRRAGRLIAYQQYRVDVHAHEQSINEWLRVDPLILPVGVEGHALTFVRYKDILIRCDRQENGDVDDYIEYYKMKRAPTLPMLRALLYEKQTTEAVQHDIIKAWGLEKVGDLTMPAQVSGNCSWANVEAVVPAILFLLFDEQQQDERFKSKQKALHIFSLWKEWDRDRALYFCIESFKSADAVRRATKAEILSAILFQCLVHTQDELRARKILNVLSLPAYRYMIDNYLRVYCKDTKTAEGDQLKTLLKHCEYGEEA